jgi:glutathione S-transferase
MSGLILHNYAMSPFAEKMRSMLGYAQLEWQSVTTREMPPRPMLARLAGGYRKIPVAQMGADVFCDTRVIASEIATLSNKPLLALENCSPDVQAFVKEVDLEVFFDCIMAGGSKRLRDKVRLAHLQRMEGRIKHDFLFATEPCHGDFSAYHSLWFIRDLGERSFINDYPNTIAWMDRMKAFGHGKRIEISAEAALAQARSAQPRAVPDELRQDSLIGRTVSIAPSDYGRDATTGTLVGSGPHRWILARESGDLGTVHVHFPRAGFTLSPV